MDTSIDMLQMHNLRNEYNYPTNMNITKNTDYSPESWRVIHTCPTLYTFIFPWNKISLNTPQRCLSPQSLM